ncbi:Endoribonuclease YBEY, chloroplastic [Vitis vinifera]|uniref:Endoribonuclease YBEY, chloroplastic n=1 Tax=Vitis vinifera TaxID=29760 RepID=A0A438H4I8_VITVI|nr:Endoribonuclease YBEY, chloroplastic [Vitis vinifera]
MSGFSKRFGRILASQRGYRKLRRRPAKSKAKELELGVKICIEEELPDDPENFATNAYDDLFPYSFEAWFKNIAEMLRLDVPIAMKLAFEVHIANSTKNGGTRTMPLMFCPCHNIYLNLKLPILMLGDIVISVETAARQAEERGHTLLDEIRILMVHGLLHLLGFDHEISDEAEVEMEKGGRNSFEDSFTSLSWFFFNTSTMLNSKSQITATTAKALKEALSRGVKVVVATGKARPAVITALKAVDLVGKDGVISEFSPGVFIQVYLFPLVLFIFQHAGCI